MSSSSVARSTSTASTRASSSQRHGEPLRRRAHENAFPVGKFGTTIDELVHTSLVFKDCSYDFVETLILQMQRKLFRPGQEIVKEGTSTPSSMFFVVLGEASVKSNGDHCEDTIEGQAFGEAMLLGASSSWRTSVVAKTQCMVCELPKETLEDTLEEYPEDADRFREAVVAFTPLSKREEKQGSCGWKLLKQCALLGRLSDGALKALDTCMDRRLYFPGQCLFAEHSTNDTLYVIEFGSVAVVIGGRTVRVEEAPAGRVTLSVGEEPMESAGRRQSEDLKRDMVGDNDRSKSPMCDSSEDERVGRGIGRTSTTTAPEVDAIPVMHSSSSRHTDTNDVVVLGEEEVLKLSNRRSASAVARKLCSVRVLYRSSLLRVVAKYPSDHAMLSSFRRRDEESGSAEQGDVSDASIMDRQVWPSVRLTELPLFSDSDCSGEFLQFLADRMEHRMFAPKGFLKLDALQRYVHPPQPKNNVGLCHVQHGLLEVRTTPASKVWPSEVKELRAGDVIPGALFYKGNARIRAVEFSFVSILHQSIIARVLEDFETDRDTLLPKLQNLVSPAVVSNTNARDDVNTQVTKILRERSIFSSTSTSFVERIMTLGKMHVFMPGDYIIEQGSDGTSMFILSLGCANVVKESADETSSTPTTRLTNVGQLTDGSVFGELVMLGVQPRRTASIIAATVCCAWEVGQDSTLAILEDHPVERANFVKLIEEHLDKLTAPRIIYHPLFSRFHQHLRTLLAVHCERRVYFPNEAVIREGSVGDKLYIINIGKASVAIHHQHVMTVTGGSHFGFAAVSGTCPEELPGILGGPRDNFVLTRYVLSVIAETMCQVLIISRACYQHGLHKYPEMKEVAMALEVEERSRAHRQKLCFTRMVNRRNNLTRTIEALRGMRYGRSLSSNKAEDEGLGSLQCLQVTFTGWKSTMARRQETLREEEEQRLCTARRIEKYLTKRREQMAHVKPRIDLKLLVDKNLVQRGPLELGKRPVSVREEHGRLAAEKSTALQSLAEKSPYLRPSPVWRTKAFAAFAPAAVRAAAAARRLPPLVVAPKTLVAVAKAAATATAGASGWPPTGSARGFRHGRCPSDARADAARLRTSSRCRGSREVSGDSGASDGEDAKIAAMAAEVGQQCIDSSTLWHQGRELSASASGTDSDCEARAVEMATEDLDDWNLGAEPQDGRPKPARDPNHLRRLSELTGSLMEHL